MNRSPRSDTVQTGARRRRVLRRGLAALMLACAGCAAPPAVHLHTLMPAERPTPREGVTLDGHGPAIVLEAIGVPTQDDQPQWLIRLPDETLARLEQERWASPLSDELHQALLELLTLRFGAVETRSAAPDLPTWRIRVEITRFDSMPGVARLESAWSLTPRGAAASALRCRSYFSETAAAGMPALAEAHRRNVARLGTAIGEQLLALQRGESGHCPS